MTYQALTEDDKARFLELTAAGWTFQAAAAAVRPAASGPRAGVSTIRAALDRDIEFQARYEEAQEQFRNSILQEAITRGIEGVEEPLSYRGKLTGDVVKKKDTAVLLRLLSGHFPEFSSQTVNHTGRVEHDHKHGHVVIDASQVYRLSPQQRQQLAEMLPILSGETDESQADRQRALVAPIDVPFNVEEEEADSDYVIPAEGF